MEGKQMPEVGTCEKGIVRCLATFALLLGSFAVTADEGHVDDTFRYFAVSVPQLAEAPVLDGVVEEDEWQGAAMGPRFYQQSKDNSSDICER